MKILFVEDELGLNIKRIINIFGKILSSEEKKELNALIKEQKELHDAGISSYIANKEVINLINNPLIDICCSFPDAVKHVKERNQDYDLYIVDRNLEKEDYELSEIQEIFQKFTEEKYCDYISREGDFLLEMLIGTHGVDCNNKFYFLTANANDSLRCKELFEKVITLEQFTAENILEKGNSKHTEKVLDIIEDFKRGNFRVKMKDVFEVFEKGLLSRDVEKQFLETLRQMDNHNETTIKDNLARIRRIQEAVYNELSKYSDEILPVSLIKNDKGFLAMRPIIKHLADKGYHNGVIKSFAYDIFGISSDGGSHTPYENPDYMPTKYTVQALTYALCDLLLWYKSIVSI